MKPKRARYVVLALLIIAVFSLAGMKMYDMQIVAGTDYKAKADTKTTKTIQLTGMRGTIYDANLIPLAYDKLSYNVQFYRDPSLSGDKDRAALTQSIIKTIELIESNGKTTTSEFWLKKDESGVWRFDTGATGEVDKKRQDQWRQNFYLTDVPEEKLFETLVENYAVPKDLPDEEKVKVLAVWQQSRMYNYLSMPVTIAEDVGLETVSEIEVRSMELDGMSIQESSTRVYPKGSTAAHVIGYTSKISGEDTLANYKEKGYANDATVGQTGIEYSMEDQLTPYIKYRQGERVVEINNRGKVIREISYQAPVDGNDVVLTIDTQLQAVAEAALAKNIQAINKNQINLMNTANWRTANREKMLAYEEAGKQVQLAKSGALVAMNPNTGEVLALVNYPTFDLSQFEGGKVPKAYWNELYNDEAKPMYNRAISARDTPGSCFKMVTALASLMEGAVTLDEQITDAGKFTGTGDLSNQPSCWIGSYNRYQHANQTIVDAIRNSCNYFFYTIGLRLGIDNLVKWAALLGLTSRTGIELPNESTSFIGNQYMLYDSDRAVDNQYTSKPYFAAVMIKKTLREVGKDRGIEYNEDRLNEVSKKILDVVNSEGVKDTWVSKVRKILLEDMNIPSEYISSHFLVNTFISYINDLRWTASETIMAAIGQSITQVTPIAVARYVSAICNGGVVYDAKIIDKIISPTGAVVLDKEPVAINYISGGEAYFAAIQEGMKEVTSTEHDGPIAAKFAKSPYKIAGKTGTAQRSDVDIENNSWLVTYAPYDSSPEIVVVVYIQNGYAGSSASDTAIATINYYLDSKQKTELLTAPISNSVAQ
ncbi:MAG: penicillin-binding transpeptidase domain-containing protein [Clostridia bacterium]